MSVSRNRKNKARRAAELAETKRLRREIKQGILPRLHFAKDEKDNLHREQRGVKKRLSFKLLSTLAVLTK